MILRRKKKYKEKNTSEIQKKIELTFQTILRTIFNFFLIVENLSKFLFVENYFFQLFILWPGGHKIIILFQTIIIYGNSALGFRHGIQYEFIIFIVENS